MEKIFLCRCNRCDSLLIDENPKTGAVQYNLNDFPNALDMEYFTIDRETGEAYLGCPLCNTDEYLMDDEF